MCHKSQILISAYTLFVNDLWPALKYHSSQTATVGGGICSTKAHRWSLPSVCSCKEDNICDHCPQCAAFQKDRDSASWWSLLTVSQCAVLQGQRGTSRVTPFDSSTCVYRKCLYTNKIYSTALIGTNWINLYKNRFSRIRFCTFLSLLELVPQYFCCPSIPNPLPSVYFWVIPLNLD